MAKLVLTILREFYYAKNDGLYQHVIRSPSGTINLGNNSGGALVVDEDSIYFLSENNDRLKRYDMKTKVIQNGS